jgi:hypothetical protein
MSNELNLLPSQAKFQAEKMHWKMIINNFLWVFGGFWLLLVVLVFLLSLIKNLSLKKLNTEYKTVLAHYESLSENMLLNQKIKYQAKIVAKVLANRFEYGESMKLVSNLFSGNIIINKLDISDEKKFKINGGLLNGEAMDGVEDLVENINSGLVDGFKSAAIREVSVDLSKGWNFMVEVELE